MNVRPLRRVGLGVGLGLSVGLSTGCPSEPPPTCDDIEADGQTCGSSWNVHKNFAQPFLIQVDATTTQAITIPGLQTCMLPDYAVFVDWEHGPNLDQALEALGDVALAEIRAASVDKCQVYMEQGNAPLDDTQIETLCESYAGDAYPLLIDNDAQDINTSISQPCIYSGPWAPPYQKPLSLVVSTPTDTAFATGHVGWTTTCTRTSCTSTIESLDVRLDEPLSVAAATASYTLTDGEFRLDSKPSGTRALTTSTITVGREQAKLAFEGHALAGTLTVPVDGVYTNPAPLTVSLPSRGNPSFVGTFVVSGVPVTVTTR
ncbi:MAG: hypothetical protein ABMB14_33985 [Myxococcota bacterium]